jgi:hypothetical protein
MAHQTFYDFTGRAILCCPGMKNGTNYRHILVLPLATRQIIVTNVQQVQTSCGFSVPYYQYAGERDHAEKWALNKGAQGLEMYKQEKNLVSLDGLPTALAVAND